MEGNINQDDKLLELEQVQSTLSLKFERLNVYNKDNTDDEEIEKTSVTSKFKGCCNNYGKYGHNKKYFRGNGNN